MRDYDKFTPKEREQLSKLEKYDPEESIWVEPLSPADRIARCEWRIGIAKQWRAASLINEETFERLKAKALADINADGTAAREQISGDTALSTRMNESNGQDCAIVQEESVDETVTDTRVSPCCGGRSIIHHTWKDAWWCQRCGLVYGR